MIAEVASGKTGLADVLFLVGFILFAIAAVAEVIARPSPPSPWWRLLVASGLACVALGWMVL
jgi:ABC-type multidrug transport system permease subunit